jgi:hypothetical protein
MKTKKTIPKTTCPLNLANQENFWMIKWDKLTEDDIIKTDFTGRTLLHHAAKAGLWEQIPHKLRDKKYWKETTNGETIYMSAFKSPAMEWINPQDLNEEEILKKDKEGNSLLSIACRQQEVKNIPKQSISQKVLKENSFGNDRYIHTIARNDEFQEIPKDQLNTELLLIKGEDGDTTYHILARIGQMHLLPKDLITVRALQITNENGKTPLNDMAQYDPELIPKELLTTEKLLETQHGYSALHRWAMGPKWASIPAHLLTKESLALKSDDRLTGGQTKSVLGCLASSYNNNLEAENDKEIEQKKHLMLKAISLVNTHDLEEINKTIKETEKHITNPKMKPQRISIIIKKELAKRKVIKKIKKEVHIEL